MPLLNVSEYAPYVHRLLVGQLKLVAYGVSPIVNLAYPLQPAYFVARQEIKDLPESTKIFWRQKPLASLADEDPRTTIIMVCCGKEDEAWKDVSAYGDFPVIKFFSYEFLSPYLPALTALPKTFQRTKKNVSARRAIVVRGAIGNDNNLFAVQKIAQDHPDDLVIVSTWDDAPPELLERVGASCDQVLTSPKPAYGGSQNRNSRLRKKASPPQKRAKPKNA